MSDNAMTADPSLGSSLDRFLAFFDRVYETICVLLVLASAGVAVLQVFCRYGLNAALPWPEEVSIWLFTWAVFLGMALAVGRKAHIAIDLINTIFPPNIKRLHERFVEAVVAATSIMMIVHGLDFAGRAIQVSPAMQWPLKYLFISIVIGGFFNLFYLIRPVGGSASMSRFVSVLIGVGIYLVVRHGAALVWQEAGSATALMLVGFGLVFLEVPIAFALAFGAFTAFAPLGDIMLVIVPQNMTSSLNSFTLLAIPFFIMAAAVMNVGGITTRLIALATSLVGHFRGGLGQANVVTNTLLAGVSGSSTADASAIAKLMVPEMEKHGYHRAFSCALTAAAATLANLIPPSLGLIIYAALASVSVGALFVATIIPGLMCSAALIIVVYCVSRIKGFGGNIERVSWGVRGDALTKAIPALLLPLMIVGGVRFGVFTATEAGAVAFVYAILCGVFVYRCLNGRDFFEAVRESTFDTIIIVVIIAAAAPFAWVLAAEQVPQKIAAAMGAYTQNSFMLLLLINIFLLIVGLFMEMIAAMVILVPILVPLVVAAGVDPVQFGIVLVMNLVIGALTPPMGVLVFTTARVGGANVVEVFKAVMPFMLALVVVLMLVTYIPSLTLAPVRWLGP